MSIRDLDTKTVELPSIGLTLTLRQSNWRISRKKDRLEKAAQENPLADPDDQLFAENFYPILAAAVISDNCPDVETCLEDVSEDDLDKWYIAAREINPSWFVFMDSIRELMEQKESSDTETKKEPEMSLNEEE